MAKASRKPPGRKRKAAEAQQSAPKQPKPERRARGRPAKPKVGVEVKRSQPLPVELISLLPAEAVLSMSRKVSKRPWQPHPVREVKQRRGRVRREQLTPTATPSPQSEAAEGSVRHDAFAVQPLPKQLDLQQSAVSALHSLDEKIRNGHKELSGLARSILRSSEAVSNRMALFGSDISAVNRRLQDIEESLKALTRSLQQPQSTRHALVDLHEMLREHPASPERAAVKLRRGRRVDKKAHSATDSARRSAEKPAKVPGRRGRRSQTTGEPSAAEPEHPNLYTADKEEAATAEEGRPSTAWTQPEAKAEAAPTPLFAGEAPLGNDTAADARPDAPAPASPLPQTAVREAPLLFDQQLQLKELEFAEAVQVPPRSVLPAAYLHPRALFNQPVEKKDFF